MDDYNKLVDSSFYNSPKVQLITQTGDRKFPVSKKLNYIIDKYNVDYEIVPGVGGNSFYFEIDSSLLNN